MIQRICIIITIWIKEVTSVLRRADIVNQGRKIELKA